MVSIGGPQPLEPGSIPGHSTFLKDNPIQFRNYHDLNLPIVFTL